MDKVIIDGVDVSGCDFYNDCKCSAQEHYAEGEFLWAEECEECPDCYYKQLKRKEQENEELKRIIFNYGGENFALEQDRAIYTQALQEIRDITEKEIVCDNCNFEGTDKCDARMCTHFYLNDFSKDILAKINEVIGAE